MATPIFDHEILNDAKTPQPRAPICQQNRRQSCASRLKHTLCLWNRMKHGKCENMWESRKSKGNPRISLVSARVGVTATDARGPLVRIESSRVEKCAKYVRRRTFTMAGTSWKKILLSEHRTSEPMIGHVLCLPESDWYLSRSFEGLYGKTHHHVHTSWHMFI